MLIRVVDLETTGFPPDASICEIGWTDVIYESKDVISVGTWQSRLVNPQRKIELAAMAVHHITDEDVAEEPTLREVLEETRIFEGIDYVAAHHTGFERQFLRDFTEAPWICTLKAAYRLCPKSPNHQNQTIRYFLKTQLDRALAVHTHRAGPDTYVTAHTLAKFLTAVSPEVLNAWEGEPPQMPYCPIGAEWKGKPWPDVDTSFLRWIMKTAKMDLDIKHNAKRELDRRYPQHQQRHEQNDTGGFLSGS